MEGQGDLLLARGGLIGEGHGGQGLEGALKIGVLQRLALIGEGRPVRAVRRGEGAGLALQGHVHLADILQRGGQYLLVPESVIGGGHQRLVLRAGNLIEQLGLAHPGVGGDLLLALPVGGGLRRPLIRIAADVQRKGAGGPVLSVVGDLDGQLGAVQAAGLEIVVVGAVGHAVRQRQGLDGLEIVLHPVGIQRDLRPVPLGEVHIVLPVGVAAVLLVGDGVVLRAGEAQLRHLAEGGDVVLVDQLVQGHVKLVQGVVGRQVHVSVPNGDIPLGVHLAVVPQLDCMSLPAGGDADGAHRVIQAVLPQIVHIFDDKGGAEGREGFQK